MATYYDQFGNPVQFVRAQQTQQPHYQTQQLQQYQPAAAAGYTGRTPYPPDSYDQSRAVMPPHAQTSAVTAPTPTYGYPPDRYPLRQPRVARHAETPKPRKKKKSTTRKLVEGGLAAGLGIAASSYLANKHRTSRTAEASGAHQEQDTREYESQHLQAPAPAHEDSHNEGSHGSSIGGPIINKVLEGVLLTAEGVGLAHLRKSRGGPHADADPEETDPRLKRLVEGALATAGALAIAYHDKKNSKPTREHPRSRSSRDFD